MSNGHPDNELPAALGPDGGQPTDNAIDELLQQREAGGRKQGGEAKRIAKRARRRRRIELMSSEDLVTEGKRRDLVLRERVATFALWGVSAELLIANAVFVAYAWVGKHWNLPTAAIDVWLSATVVQIIGILYVIANYLFPKSGTPLSHDDA